MRSSKATIVALALLAWSLSWSNADAGVPTQEIKTAVDKALAVLKDPHLKSAAKFNERRDQLRQILFARFDFTEMAKRALGSNWRRRTAQEQEEFVRLFTELLERAYAELIESYTDEKIIYTNERINGNYADVGSKIRTSRGEETLSTRRPIGSATSEKSMTPLPRTSAWSTIIAPNSTASSPTRLTRNWCGG